MGHTCCDKQESYIPYALSILKQHGYKSTPSRTKLLYILEKSNGPISPSSIIASYPEEHFDKVTLYRFFDILAGLHLVQKIHSLNSYIRTEGHKHPHQHYFLVCVDCHSLKEKVTDSMMQGITNMGLYQNHHCIEIVGRCDKCVDSHKA